MRPIFTFIFLLSFFSFSAAQTTSPSFDPDFAEQLQQTLTAYGQSSGTKGFSAAAIVPGQGIWVGTFGEAAPGVPLTPDMRLGIASNSKAITAALLLKLQEEGLLSLDDTVGDYLPPHPYVDEDITLRELLTHTSGLFDFINDWSDETSSTYYDNPNMLWTPEDLLATVGQSYLLPGTAYNYSNTNFLVAGMVAAAAADTTIEYLLHNRIFEPLDLDMAYPPYDDVFAQPYSNLWSGNNTTLNPNNDDGFLSFPATAGSVWSTAYDMVRWYDSLFGDEWLTPESQAALRENDGYIPYGLGIRLRNRFGVSYYYHAGAWGFRSFNIHVPEQGISVCVLANDYAASTGSITRELLNQILNTKPEKEHDVVALKATHPSGTFCVGNEDPMRVQIRNRGLMPLEEVKVKYGIDGVLVDSFIQDLPSPIQPNATAFVEMGMPGLPADGQIHHFQIRLEPTETDGYPLDNTAYSDFRILPGEGLPLPYYEGFETEDYLPQDWLSLNPRNILDWRRTDFADREGESSLVRNNYSDANTNINYPVELPPLFISDETSQLSFSFAHTAYPGYDDDALQIQVSEDCGESFQTVINLSGEDFNTGPQTSDLFLPLVPFYWDSRSTPLGSYVGKTVIVRFLAINGFSNHVYIDDVNVSGFVSSEEAFAQNGQVSGEIQVAPNPAKDFFTVKLPDDFSAKTVEMELTDAAGKVVRRHTVLASGQIKMERDGLPAGVYFLRVKTEEGDMPGVKVVFL